MSAFIGLAMLCYAVWRLCSWVQELDERISDIEKDVNHE